MKHRIQNPEYRIQKAENAHGFEDVVGRTPTAVIGTVAVPGNRREGGQKTASIRTGAMEKRTDVGKGGQEIGKWRNFFHLAPASTRLFPPFSTQVVDFPHIENVRLFWGGHEIGFSHGQAELGTKIGKLN